MNTKLQKEIQRELIESFKVFYSSLYQHKSVDQVKEDEQKYLDDIIDLMSVSDDVELKVKFVCQDMDKKITHTRYQQIQEFVKNGVDIGEDVANFVAVIRAGFRKNGIYYHNADNTPFFKSEPFVIKEVDKEFASLCEADAKITDGEIVVVSKGKLQEFSNGRIRFGEEKTLEA